MDLSCLRKLLRSKYGTAGCGGVSSYRKSKSIMKFVTTGERSGHVDSSVKTHKIFRETIIVVV